VNLFPAKEETSLYPVRTSHPPVPSLGSVQEMLFVNMKKAKRVRAEKKSARATAPNNASMITIDYHDYQ